MKIETMKDIIDYAAETYKNQSAFRYKIRKEVFSKTYEEVRRDSQSVSSMLQNLGMLGMHIAVIGPTSYEWIISYFGVVNSGGVIVPLDVQLLAGDICERLVQADVSVLIYDEQYTDAAAIAKKTCPKLLHTISMQTDLPKLLTEQGGSFTTELNKDKLCAIMFTSENEGMSRGVMLSHKNLTYSTVCLDLKIPSGTVSMTLLPIHQPYCFAMDILKGLYMGVTICINDSIMQISRNMKLFKPEIMVLEPEVMDCFSSSVHTVYSDNAYLDSQYIDQLEESGVSTLQSYGMTECSSVIAANLPWERKKNSVGKLVPNCQVKNVDGELWVRGFSVMLGYYNMPKETSEKLEGGWLKTGDLGYADEDGFIYITGKKKQF